MRPPRSDFLSFFFKEDCEVRAAVAHERWELRFANVFSWEVREGREVCWVAFWPPYRPQ